MSLSKIVNKNILKEEVELLMKQQELVQDEIKKIAYKLDSSGTRGYKRVLREELGIVI